MDGIHDLGGMQGFGAVEREDDEPVFHEPWEGRTFATVGLSLGAVGINTPMFRHAIERMDPAHYLASGYYEHWLTAATTLLVDAGVVTIDELEARAGGAVPHSRPVLPGAAQVSSAAVDGPLGARADDRKGSARNNDREGRRAGVDVPRFAIGSTVRVLDAPFDGHTRCPRYVRGHVGEVIRVDDAFPVAEIEAHRQEKVLEYTYGVRFTARELWGDTADAAASVTVDLYEHHLASCEGHNS